MVSTCCPVIQRRSATDLEDEVTTTVDCRCAKVRKYEECTSLDRGVVLEGTRSRETGPSGAPGIGRVCMQAIRMASTQRLNDGHTKGRCSRFHHVHEQSDQSFAIHEQGPHRQRAIRVA